MLYHDNVMIEMYKDNIMLPDPHTILYYSDLVLEIRIRRVYAKELYLARS